jgi:transcriptional regulator with XRE-family HTH domain
MGIGDMLRREREKRGLSLVDVENATKIRVRYIQALESEQYQIIPGEVYRLGFLKNYARLLDLDPGAIIARYKSARESAEHSASHNEEPAGTQQAGADVRPAVRPAVRDDVRPAVRDDHRPETRQAEVVARRPDVDWAAKITLVGSIFKNRRVLLGVASAVIVLLLAYAALHIGVSHHNNAPPQQTTQNLPVVPSAVDTQPQGLEIRLVGIGHCEAEVKVDGQLVYTGTIKPGDTETFTAQSTVWVDLGYPQSVDVYYNGAKLPPLGTTSPVTQTFTKNMGA